MNDLNRPQGKIDFEGVLKAGTNRMNSALHAFYIWKWINDIVNINSPGGREAAERNVDTLSTYASIFQSIKISSCTSPLSSDTNLVSCIVRRR